MKNEIYKKLDNSISHNENGYYWNNIYLGKDRDSSYDDVNLFKKYIKEKDFRSNIRILSSSYFNKTNIDKLFKKIEKLKIKKIKNKTVIGYYLSDSLRTRLSFEKSCSILGIKYIYLSNEKSSVKSDLYVRGESEKDIIVTMCTFSDLLIVRHPSVFYPYFLNWVCELNNISTSYINAGSGTNDHPTQAISDLYLIYKYIKRKSINICFYGDCKNIRSIRSLSYLLPFIYTVNIIFFCPIHGNPEASLLKMITDKKANYSIVNGKSYEEDVLAKVDVVYLVRYTDNYIINENNIRKLKKDAIIMHPLPKDGEITSKLIPSECKSLKYIEQMKTSVLVRLFLISDLLEKDLYKDSHNYIS